MDLPFPPMLTEIFRRLSHQNDSRGSQDGAQGAPTVRNRSQGQKKGKEGHFLGLNRLEILIDGSKIKILRSYSSVFFYYFSSTGVCIPPPKVCLSRFSWISSGLGPHFQSPPLSSPTHSQVGTERLSLRQEVHELMARQAPAGNVCRRNL